ncbi:MAG: hypothetical protein HYY16_13470 [Planctomycetes bacterium]|nr:hypothetical protein [Planctomycetota bacterium]
MKLAIHVRSGGPGGHVQAYCPDFPGCSASAPTEEEAIGLLRRRIERLLTEGHRKSTPPRTVRRVIEI